jgi:hypothetical protein
MAPTDPPLHTRLLVPRPVSFFQKRKSFRGTRLAEASQINNLCANQRSSDGKDFLVGALVISIGTGFGLLLALLFWWSWTRFWWWTQPREGTEFSSLDDLRAAMIQRDGRDVKSDGSLSLRSIVQPHPRDDIIYTLRPNLSVRFQGVDVRTNSKGMRYKEVEVSKPKETLRIALMGDSFTFGWGVREEESFASLLEALLSKTIVGKKIEVLNFGIPGYSTFQEVALYKELASKFSPDLALFFVVDNDFGFPFFIKGDTLTPVSKENSEEARKSGMLETIDANKALTRLYNSLSVPLLLAINPSHSYDSVRQKLWVLKKIPGIQELRLRERMKAIIEERRIDPKDLTLSHDPHPSPLKHQLLAEILSERLSGYLKE